MADTEIWKDIEGYNGYMVSNQGRIKSVDRDVDVFRHGKTHKRTITTPHNNVNKKTSAFRQRKRKAYFFGGFSFKVSLAISMCNRHP